MYIPIGMDLSVRERVVIGVFDLDNTSWSKRTKEFLERAEENGEIVEATDSLPKSFVLTHEYGMQRVYLTKSNAAALQKRMQRQENLHRNKGVSL
ncbi:MAG: DUF370 domain-containing protein [Oscillospiraceae bacterium]|nr:DUF370 domain-containing protein [Oscillospiraceae bacterium]